jgi:hypothetical protein
MAEPVNTVYLEVGLERQAVTSEDCLLGEFSQESNNSVE